MKRTVLAALVLILAIGMQPQAAHAQPNYANSNWNAFWAWFSHGQDPRLTGVGTGSALAPASPPIS